MVQKAYVNHVEKNQFVALFFCQSDDGILSGKAGFAPAGGAQNHAHVIPP
jgi:hypothetical protein